MKYVQAVALNEKTVLNACAFLLNDFLLKRFERLPAKIGHHVSAWLSASHALPSESIVRRMWVMSTVNKNG